MGEEAAKQEEVNNKGEEKVVEEKKEEEEAKPALPFVLLVDLHCVGCAKKIERSIMKIRGVEAVTIDMAKNEVTIKGIVDPQAVCNKITKRTKRRTQVLSPNLPPSEGEPIPQLITSQVSGPVTVELNVNMHCEACADQLKTKILKMRGVQTAITELSTGKVTVTGTMDANKLVDYVYRRTKKQAIIVPQPEPEPEPKPEPEPEKKEEESKEAEKPSEEAKPEEEGAEKPAEGEAKKEESGGEKNKDEEGIKRELVGEENINHNMAVIDHHNYHHHHEEHMNRMMMYQQYHQPLYMIERIPPPQLFSDENPNACCIS